MQLLPEEQKVMLEDTAATSAVASIYHVILFNDEVHDFDEVINQLIKATGCSYPKAEQLTIETHNNGKAAVYEGTLVDCIHVSSILEEIALHTQIEL